MLAKNQRLRKQTDIDFVYKTGKKVYHPFFRIIYLEKDDQINSRYTVVVGKKISTSAVQRNLMKRRLRNAFENQLPNIKKKYDFIIIAQNKAKTVEYQELNKSLEKVFIEEKLI